MMIKEHGMIFQPWGVKSIKAGDKTQTRRLMGMSNMLYEGRHWTPRSKIFGMKFKWDDFSWLDDYDVCKTPYLSVVHIPAGKVCAWYPKFKRGDLIWVKETMAEHEYMGGRRYKADGPFIVKNDSFGSLHFGKWKSSMLMSRKESRLDLRITDIRIQRLQDISEEDSQAEGIKILTEPDRAPEGTIMYAGQMDFTEPFREIYRSCWDSLAAEASNWESNPWVITNDFRVEAITAGWDFTDKGFN